MMVESTTSEGRQTLERVISFKNFIAIAFGAIIGVGWIVYAGEWLQGGGPGGAILAFILGGLLLIPIGKCYAELAPAIPVAGGEIAFAYRAFGVFVSFICGWLLTLNYAFVLPFETIAIGALFNAMFPGIEGEALYMVGASPVTWSTLIPGLGIGLYVMILNYRGTRGSVRFQTFAMYMILIITAVFTVVALTKGSVSNLTPLFAHDGPLWSAVPASIISVIVVVPWFMGGFDAIPQAAEESGAGVAASKLGTAIIASIVMGIAFYAIVIFDLAISMPWRESCTFDMPTAAVFRVAFGYEWAAQLVLFTGMLGLITTLNGFYIASSRLLFAMGRGGLLPEWFGRVHPRYHTPKNAVLFVGAMALIGPFLGKAALAPIVNSSAFTFVICFCITCYAAIRLRTTAPDLERPYRVRWKGTLYLGLIVSVFLVGLMVFPGSPGRLSLFELWVVVIWSVVGLVAYFYRRKSSDLTEDERGIQILGDYR
jgi:APA family basic amino acid/polyamine antiporter